MIRFQIVCSADHEFEAWFRNSDDFDAQADRKLVSCPVCATTEVQKALMAPSVATSKGKKEVALAAGGDQKKVMAEMVKLARKLRENADNVGDKFAEEALKIHHGETDPRGIYGKATHEEAKGLVDEGVDFLPLPPLPEDQN